MRTLVDLGLTRDQGEGIPRMFAEMADAFLPTPRINPTPRSVSVVLRNTTTLGEDDRAFVARIGGEDLSDEEFRALLQAHRSTQVDNASLRSLMGFDTLGASQILRRLRDRGLLELHPAGSQSFYTLAPRLRSAESADRGEQVPDRGELQSDRGELGPDRGEQLAPSLLEAIAALGVRSRKEPLRQVIAQLCAGHWRTPAWLADQLKMKPRNLSERHLAPMVRDGTLKRRYPESPTHPEQAYLTVLIQNSLLPSTSE
jgi:ATP-dependent DNA helicase RecG